jgi:N-acetylmuramoyl-L-alanine amidase
MPTGKDIVEVARRHIGEKYVFGAPVPKDNPAWRGPWDCAEFASWCIYQVSQKLYGCHSNSGAPASADAYTGYWGRDAGQLGIEIPFTQAAAIQGALVLRNPGEKCGHIVISDGRGGTIEAHSTARGVIADTLDNRRWDIGILIPWITYTPPDQVPVVPQPGLIYRVTSPLMEGDTILAIQKALVRRKLNPGELDGKYGPHTAAAVTVFQRAKGLVADGEVGPQTARALGIRFKDEL